VYVLWLYVVQAMQKCVCVCACVRACVRACVCVFLNAIDSNNELCYVEITKYEIGRSVITKYNHSGLIN